MANPDAFRPLLPSAARELARQINEAAPNAQHLVSRAGFGWSLAIEITRQMVGGGNPTILESFGLSPQVARAIGLACDDAIAARTPVTEAEPRPQRTFRGAHMAARGIRPNFARM